MSNLLSREKRRGFVAVNFSSLILLAVFVLWGEYSYWNLGISLGAIASFTVLVVTFFFLHLKTGLWKLTHAKTSALDERELQIMHRAHSKSYAALGLISLVVLFFLFVTVRYSLLPLTHSLTHRGHYSFGLMVLTVFNYLINTLPASFIAWNEKHAG